jgi:hypothetical protein
MTHPNPAHLFISYANEDLALARWLARKLAARGHPVWFDKIKTLGGEPWPQTADETIKSRTFRVLALISEHSARKKKPALERMLAQRVVRQQKISDFLIPLQMDGSKPEELTDAAAPISFENSWGDGWETLLKKLDSVDAPLSLENGAKLASSSFPQGEDLTNDIGEPLFTNLIRIQSFPKVLRVFQAPEDMEALEWEALESAWTFYEITKDTLIAVIPPPPQFFDRIRTTRRQLPWTEPGAFQGVPHRKIASTFILQALARRLIKAGCSRHPDPKFKETFFLPQNFANNGQLPFNSFEGKKLKIPIREKVSFRRLGVMEVNFHHFAFRLRLTRGLAGAFNVQITPTLVFFDEKGGPVDEKSALSRIRRVTKTWQNEEWLNRVMAAAGILISSPPAGVNDPVLEPGLVTLPSPRKLEEALIEPDSVKREVESLDHEFELEEPELEPEDTDE